MGKCFRRNSRKASQVSLVELSVHAQPSLGVCTRAKALALQRSLPSQHNQSAAGESGASESYLQLRSRRLEKPPIIVSRAYSRRDKHNKNQNFLRNPSQKSGSRASSRLKVASAESKSVGSASLSAFSPERDRRYLDSKKKSLLGENVIENDTKQTSGGEGVEASFGENVLEFDGGERSTRETTPCSLIRDPDCIRTPGSTTRRTCSTEANCRAQNSLRSNIPTSHEMNEFFAGAEAEQQKKFIRKYNYDPVKDKPLPGQYEWQKMNP